MWNLIKKIFGGHSKTEVNYFVAAVEQLDRKKIPSLVGLFSLCTE